MVLTLDGGPGNYLGIQKMALLHKILLNLFRITLYLYNYKEWIIAAPSA